MSSDRSALITSTQIEQAADRGRDVVSLLRLLPGVASQTPSDAPAGNFGTTTHSHRTHFRNIPPASGLRKVQLR